MYVACRGMNFEFQSQPWLQFLKKHDIISICFRQLGFCFVKRLPIIGRSYTLWWQKWEKAFRKTQIMRDNMSLRFENYHNFWFNSLESRCYLYKQFIKKIKINVKITEIRCNLHNICIDVKMMEIRCNLYNNACILKWLYTVTLKRELKTKLIDLNLHIKAK